MVSREPGTCFQNDYRISCVFGYPKLGFRVGLKISACQRLALAIDLHVSNTGRIHRSAAEQTAPASCVNFGDLKFCEATEIFLCARRLGRSSLELLLPAILLPSTGSKSISCWSHKRHIGLSQRNVSDALWTGFQEPN